MNYLRWDVYTTTKGELIKRKFLVSVPNLKRGIIVCTGVKDNIIEENEGWKDIGLRGFDYNLFE